MNAEAKEKLVLDFKNKCRRRKLKVTPQRTAIYRELINSTDHPNVEILFKRVKKILPDISFDTVYRTLSLFYNIGVADIIEGLPATRRYDGNTNKHYHFICQKCNKIIDIKDVPFEFRLPKKIKDNYDVKNLRVLIEGICKDCSKQ